MLFGEGLFFGTETAVCCNFLTPLHKTDLAPAEVISARAAARAAAQNAQNAKSRAGWGAREARREANESDSEECVETESSSLSSSSWSSSAAKQKTGHRRVEPEEKADQATKDAKTFYVKTAKPLPKDRISVMWNDGSKTELTYAAFLKTSTDASRAIDQQIVGLCKQEWTERGPNPNVVNANELDIGAADCADIKVGTTDYGSAVCQIAPIVYRSARRDGGGSSLLESGLVVLDRSQAADLLGAFPTGWVPSLDAMRGPVERFGFVVTKGKKNPKVLKRFGDLNDVAFLDHLLTTDLGTVTFLATTYNRVSGHATHIVTIKAVSGQRTVLIDTAQSHSVVFTKEACELFNIHGIRSVRAIKYDPSKVVVSNRGTKRKLEETGDREVPNKKKAKVEEPRQ